MEAPNLLLIVSAEIGALLALLCFFLLFKNRSLRRLLNKLQERMEQLAEDLRRAREQSLGEEKKPETYRKFLEKQLQMTQAHHRSLQPEQDIILDIDPSIPLPRRSAALRHAVLSIELEASAANSENAPNWQQMNRKYEQLFDFQADYASNEKPRVDLSDGGELSDGDASSEEIELLTQELKAAKKRVNNLEKFKALYLDLEGRWKDCQDTAKTQYDELSGMVANMDDSSQSESFMGALNAYQSSYSGVSQIIERGVPEQNDPKYLGDSSGEVRQLRTVAADQHRIIGELQRQLASIENDQQRSAAIDELKGQLEKQMRFVQESETCIQLMEDELHGANKELEILRSRHSAIPQLKAELKELRDARENYETQIYTLRATNQRLSRDMKSLKSQKPETAAGDSQDMKKQLLEMEAKYAELEERFLDLKLSG